MKATELGEKYLLYADDDEDDKAILVEMMRRIDPAINVVTTENGLEAVKFLEELNDKEIMPACIVLDMNMPILNGIQTLETIKKDPVYNSIPVFLFSTSSNPSDVATTSELGAEAFITKPYGQKELLEVCEEFGTYCQRPANVKDLAHKKSKV
jgi:CheY-like chemotaxis protein